MSTPRVLVVYATRYGQTARIAQRIAADLEGHGMVVSCHSLGELPPTVPITNVDAIIVGAPVFFGRHPRQVERFVRDHLAALHAVPSAFFSVSGSASHATPGSAARAEADGYVVQFLRNTGWHPRETVTIAGAVAFTRYNPLLRWMMKRIARSGGLSTDTTRDHEYTDWAQVDHFAEEFVSLLAAQEATVPA